MQFENWPEARQSDSDSVESVIAAFDEVLSFAGHEFDFDNDRFLSLFLPTANLTSPKPWQMSLSPNEWENFFTQAVKDLGFAETGFAEKNEIRRVVTIGSVNSVYTFYTLHSPPQSEAQGQGVNIWHIVEVDGRFAIAGLIWEDESETAPTPPELVGSRAL